uniref:Uncharacterized protein n=1 Tax=Cacopsylla melanoneura TaxID=428564 RepID=A0A8D8XRA5_9HEMI
MDISPVESIKKPSTDKDASPVDKILIPKTEKDESPVDEAEKSTIHMDISPVESLKKLSIDKDHILVHTLEKPTSDKNESQVDKVEKPTIDKDASTVYMVEKPTTGTYAFPVDKVEKTITDKDRSPQVTSETSTTDKIGSLVDKVQKPTNDKETSAVDKVEKPTTDKGISPVDNVEKLSLDESKEIYMVEKGESSTLDKIDKQLSDKIAFIETDVEENVVVKTEILLLDGKNRVSTLNNTEDALFVKGKQFLEKMEKLEGLDKQVIKITKEKDTFGDSKGEALILEDLTTDLLTKAEKNEATLLDVEMSEGSVSDSLTTDHDPSQFVTSSEKVVIVTDSLTSSSVSDGSLFNVPALPAYVASKIDKEVKHLEADQLATTDSDRHLDSMTSSKEDKTEHDECEYASLTDMLSLTDYIEQKIGKEVDQLSHTTEIISAPQTLFESDLNPSEAIVDSVVMTDDVLRITLSQTIPEKSYTDSKLPKEFIEKQLDLSITKNVDQDTSIEEISVNIPRDTDLSRADVSKTSKTKSATQSRVDVDKTSREIKKTADKEPLSKKDRTGKSAPVDKSKKTIVSRRISSPKKICSELKQGQYIHKETRSSSGFVRSSSSAKGTHIKAELTQSPSKRPQVNITKREYSYSRPSTGSIRQSSLPGAVTKSGTFKTEITESTSKGIKKSSVVDYRSETIQSKIGSSNATSSIEAKGEKKTSSVKHIDSSRKSTRVSTSSVESTTFVVRKKTQTALKKEETTPEQKKVRKEVTAKPMSKSGPSQPSIQKETKSLINANIKLQEIKTSKPIITLSSRTQTKETTEVKSLSKQTSQIPRTRGYMAPTLSRTLKIEDCNKENLKDSGTPDLKSQPGTPRKSTLKVSSNDGNISLSSSPAKRIPKVQKTTVPSHVVTKSDTHVGKGVKSLSDEKGQVVSDVLSAKTSSGKHKQALKKPTPTKKPFNNNQKVTLSASSFKGSDKEKITEKIGSRVETEKSTSSPKKTSPVILQTALIEKDVDKSNVDQVKIDNVVPSETSSVGKDSTLSTEVLLEATDTSPPSPNFLHPKSVIDDMEEKLLSDSNSEDQSSQSRLITISRKTNCDQTLLSEVNDLYEYCSSPESVLDFAQPDTVLNYKTNNPDTLFYLETIDEEADEEEKDISKMETLKPRNIPVIAITPDENDDFIESNIDCQFVDEMPVTDIEDMLEEDLKGATSGLDDDTDVEEFELAEDENVYQDYFDEAKALPIEDSLDYCGIYNENVRVQGDSSKKFNLIKSQSMSDLVDEDQKQLTDFEDIAGSDIDVDGVGYDEDENVLIHILDDHNHVTDISDKINRNLSPAGVITPDLSPKLSPKQGTQKISQKKSSSIRLHLTPSTSNYEYMTESELLLSDCESFKKEDKRRKKLHKLKGEKRHQRKTKQMELGISRKPDHGYSSTEEDATYTSRSPDSSLLQPEATSDAVLTDREEIIFSDYDNSRNLTPTTLDVNQDKLDALTDVEVIESENESFVRPKSPEPTDEESTLPEPTRLMTIVKEESSGNIVDVNFPLGDAELEGLYNPVKDTQSDVETFEVDLEVNFEEDTSRFIDRTPTPVLNIDGGIIQASERSIILNSNKKQHRYEDVDTCKTEKRRKCKQKPKSVAELNIELSNFNILTDTEELNMSDIETPRRLSTPTVTRYGNDDNPLTDVDDIYLSNEEEEDIKRSRAYSLTPDFIHEFTTDTITTAKENDCPLSFEQKKQILGVDISVPRFVRTPDIPGAQQTDTEDMVGSGDEVTETGHETKLVEDDSFESSVHMKQSRKLDFESNEEMLHVKNGSLREFHTDVEDVDEDDDVRLIHDLRVWDDKSKFCVCANTNETVCICFAKPGNELTIEWQDEKERAAETGTTKSIVLKTTCSLNCPSRKCSKLISFQVASRSHSLVAQQISCTNLVVMSLYYKSRSGPCVKIPYVDFCLQMKSSGVRTELKIHLLKNTVYTPNISTHYVYIPKQFKIEGLFAEKPLYKSTDRKKHNFLTVRSLSGDLLLPGNITYYQDTTINVSELVSKFEVYSKTTENVTNKAVKEETSALNQNKITPIVNIACLKDRSISPERLRPSSIKQLPAFLAIKKAKEPEKDTIVSSVDQTHKEYKAQTATSLKKVDHIGRITDRINIFEKLAETSGGDLKRSKFLLRRTISLPARKRNCRDKPAKDPNEPETKPSASEVK